MDDFNRENIMRRSDSFSVERKAESDLKNCGHCPSYGKSCRGDAQNCLCIRCPRNLGQCIKVRYCRETESVLDDLYKEDLLSEEEYEEQLRSYFSTME